MERNNDRRAFLKEFLTLASGEGAVAVLTAAIYFLVSVIFGDAVKFDYTVITGALLGAAVPLINFLILSFAVNRAVNKYIEELGTKGELTEEEAEKFAEEHKGRIQLAVTRSYIVRTLLMIAALVIAFILEWFDPVATVVPLLAYKPIMYLTQYIRARKGRS